MPRETQGLSREVHFNGSAHWKNIRANFFLTIWLVSYDDVMVFIVIGAWKLECGKLLPLSGSVKRRAGNRLVIPPQRGFTPPPLISRNSTGKGETAPGINGKKLHTESIGLKPVNADSSLDLMSGLSIFISGSYCFHDYTKGIT